MVMNEEEEETLPNIAKNDAPATEPPKSFPTRPHAIPVRVPNRLLDLVDPESWRRTYME